MTDITKQKIGIANVAKIIVFLGGLSGLFYGLKIEQQSIKDEIKLMINDYKGEDKIIHLKIENNERRDDRQDEDMKFLVEKLEGVIPEAPKRKRDR